jgi:outer membrane protein assembly factor BamA
MKHHLAFSTRALLALSLLLIAPGPTAFAQQTELPPGWVPPTPKGIVAEPSLIRKLANASDGLGGDREPADGLYPQLGNMITGAGWISAGPGYRHRVFDGRGVVDLSAAVSWKLYKVAQGRFELPHAAHDRLSIGAQAMYQDLLQVNYFGLGNESRKADRSGYRLNDVDVLGYATVRATNRLFLLGRFGWIDRPDISSATGRNITYPNTIDLFSEATAPGLQTQHSFLHGDVSVVSDWRDQSGHPTRGGLYRATVASFVDRGSGQYTFRRYEAEASQFVPIFTRKWIVALHAWEVWSDTSTDHVVPFYLMPSLGGQNTLRGYYDYRFHDNNMQVFNAESRFALFAHVDAALFIDGGKVGSKPGDLDFSHLKRSYGAGLRMHNTTSTLARIDVGHGAEGWRVFFKLTDSLKRSTPAFGRSAIVPFVP